MSLLNATQAAKYLNITKYLFNIAVRRGEIRFKILGKRKGFPIAELDKWLKDTQCLIGCTPTNMEFGKHTSHSLLTMDNECSLDRLVAQKTEEKRKKLLLKRLKY